MNRTTRRCTNSTKWNFPAEPPERSEVTKLNGTTVVAGLALALAAGCSAPEVPDEPTWAEHVKPILAAKCVRCHGFPAINGAPDSFRLDMYDNTVTDDGRGIWGARTMAGWIQGRIDPNVVAPAHKPYAIDLMPPAPESLTDEQRQTLLNWGNAQNPIPARGVRPGNSAPTMAFVHPLEDSLIIDGPLTGSLKMQYELRDADGDICGGELRVGTSLVDSTRIGSVHSGRGEVVWDVGAMPAGTYGMFAQVDDGTGYHGIDLGSYAVSHDDGNAAPTITILTPNYETIASTATTPNLEVKLRISDPDSTDLLLSVRPTLGTQDTDIGVNFIPVSTGIYTLSVDVSGYVASDQWYLHIVVNDGDGALRTKDSAKFIISHETTTDTYGDLANLFLKCNDCHGFSAPDIDIPNILGRVYRRVVRQRNMPPESFRLQTADINMPELDPQLTDAERDRIGQWLLAGAPGAQ